MASEASLCCAEEGLRVNLGHGDLVLASEASLCCIEEGARAFARARRFWLGERSEPLLHWAAHTHGPGDARAAQTHGPGVRSKILCSGEAGQRTNIRFWFFFLTKRRQKKTREQFNSEYEKKRLPRRRWVLLKWPILVIFVKKKRVFFQFATYAARAREPRLEMEKKRIFFENWKN